jgi:hypothetical protein
MQRREDKVREDAEERGGMEGRDRVYMASDSR